MEFYVFSKPGFKQRQSDKLKDANTRRAILVDCDLNNDPKILMLYAQKDVSLIGILFEIWANLDTETETWEIPKHHFDHWVRKTFSDSNRFDVQKRLQWLSNNGLIGFQCIPNEVPIGSQCIPNTPLELPETRVALRATITNTKQTKKDPPTSSEAPPPPQEKFSESHLTLANELWEVIRERYPYYKPPKMPIWAETIRKIEEIDGFTIEQIEDVAAWALTKSDFWCKQIRGPDNLRKHFRKILDQSGLYAQWEVKKRVTQG